MNTTDQSVQLDNKNFLLHQRIFIKISPERNERIKKRLYFYWKHLFTSFDTWWPTCINKEQIKHSTDSCVRLNMLSTPLTTTIKEIV